jgi:asparagine synthase (glutamine-hydrolysing)
MCGIGAIVRLGPSPIPLELLTSIHDGLIHRGPDGEGIVLVDDQLSASRFPDLARLDRSRLDSARLALAFRRLRILDLSERADAPLRRGNRWVVLNGEIYNHAELREQLGGPDAFTTTSDTEVVLAAWERWGEGAFDRMRGMWAILIVDLDRGVIAGSRDRLGIKPLFFSADSERLIFASEPQVVATARRDGARAEPYRFTEFLRGLPPQTATRSMFEGVHPVPAGSIFTIDLRSPAVPSFRKFWDLGTIASEPDDRPEAVDELTELLNASVAEHMVADVPIGVLLSGGLDSSAIARLMATKPRDVLPRSFTLSHDDPRIDETPFARAVVEQGGLDATFDRFQPGDGLAIARRVVASQGEPLLGFDLIGHYRMFELARQHDIKVALDGLGADEIFGGYPFYEAIHIMDRVRRLQWPGAIRDLRGAARRSGRSLPRLLAGYARAVRRSRHRPPEPRWLAGAPEATEDVSVTKTPQMKSALNRLLFEQTVSTNLVSTLLHQDRNSMAHSIESRVPYLDHRIVELAFALPESWKIAAGERKRVLLHTARRFVTPVVTERTEKRAIVSSARWIDLRAQPGLLDALAAAPIPYVDPHRLRAYVQDFAARKHDEVATMWRLYTASIWVNEFAIR